MKARLLWVPLLIGIVVVLSGCPGIFGPDGDAGDDVTYPTVTADVPSDSTGAVNGSAYGYLKLTDRGGDGVAYNTDLHLNPDADLDPPEFYIRLWDGTDTISIEPGTYTLDTSESEPSNGTITFAGIKGAVDGDTASYFARSEETESEFESDSPFDVDVYDQIVGGTVTISVSESVYTVEWSFTTADSETLEGAYGGSVDAEYD